MNTGYKTAKFGGTSLADAARIKKVVKIIASDKSRRYIVVSAPGLRHPEDEKVTDMFAAWGIAPRADAGALLEKIKTRISGIVEELKLEIDVEVLFKTIQKDAKPLRRAALHHFALSRGEWLCAQIVAAATGFEFVDAAEFITFDQSGTFDMEATKERAARLGLDKKAKRGVVVPGFYGTNTHGMIHTFPRGGSDITGAIVAALTKASVYENWTDVLGIRVADPRIVIEPKKIPIMTYRELRELSFMGANVFHENAVAPVRLAGIPIHVRATDEPTKEGTMIVNEISKPRHTITGIAGRSGYSVVTLLKDGMNSEVGFLARAANVFKRCGVSVDHCPGTVDSLSFVVESADLAPKQEALFAALMRACSPDSIRITDKLTLICTVGLGMAHTPGMAGILCSALGKANINIILLNQGASEINIVVGVRDDDGPSAIRTIYSAFMGRSAHVKK